MKPTPSGKPHPIRAGKNPSDISPTSRSPNRTPDALSDCQLQHLPGLSAIDLTRLQTCGITTLHQLWQQTSTAAGRQQLANQTDLPVRHITKWSALVSLAQIPSVGCRYCGLLLHAGIASPQQLAEIPLARLHQQILRLQVAVMQRPDLCPSLPEIQTWIAQAQHLSRLKARSTPNPTKRSS